MTTPTQSSSSLLVADACVLLDLARADGLRYVSDLIESSLASIYVPRAVINELTHGLTQDEVLSLGVKIVDPSFKETLEVKGLEVEEPKLSYADRTLFVLAKHREFTIWTNDRQLRQASLRRGVSASWCFTEINKLAACGIRTADEVVALAAAIEEFNPRQSGITEGVRKKLAEIVSVAKKPSND